MSKTASVIYPSAESAAALVGRRVVLIEGIQYAHGASGRARDPVLGKVAAISRREDSAGRVATVFNVVCGKRVFNLSRFEFRVLRKSRAA